MAIPEESHVNWVHISYIIRFCTIVVKITWWWVTSAYLRVCETRHSLSCLPVGSRNYNFLLANRWLTLVNADWLFFIIMTIWTISYSCQCQLLALILLSSHLLKSNAAYRNTIILPQTRSIMLETWIELYLKWFVIARLIII